MILTITLLLMCWSGAKVAGLNVTIAVSDYTHPPDYVGGPNDYKTASRLTLTCQVTGGNGTVTYEWTATCTGCFISMDTFQNQVVGRSSLQSVDSGNFTCTATRGVEMGNATIEIIVVVPPTVSSLTYDCYTRTLNCNSTGSPATTVTWTKDGDTLTVDGTPYSMTQTLTDRRTSTYENVLTLPATGDFSGTYSCQVGNALGDSNTMTFEVTGLNVTIDVVYTPPPDFVGGPNDYRAASGVTINCQAEGGTETYQWSSTCTGPNNNCFVPGKKTQTISRTTLRSTDSGTHTCTATDSVGKFNSGSASIMANIIGAGIFVNTGDGVTNVVLPNNGIVIAQGSVESGDRFSFQCRSGSTNSSVGDIIGLDGNALPIDSSGVTTGGLNVRRDSPATVFVRNPASEQAVDEGVYTCRIPDETGSDVDVNIGVYRNGFNTPPRVSSLTYDCYTRTLTCTSTGSPATTVTWTKGGDTLAVNGTTYSMDQTVTDRQTSTYGNVLTLPVTENITGTYSCQVGNSDQRTVNLRTPASLQVEITINDGDTVAGEEYTLTCTVTVPDGLTGTLTADWTGDEGKTGVTAGTPDTSGRVTTFTLTFDPLQDSQDGDYTCMAAFSCQDVTNQTAIDVQNLDVVAPEVTVNVSATGTPIVGGTNYSLTCDHDAPQSLMATVQSALVTPGGTMLTPLPHTFNPLLVADGGEYRCSATVSSPYLTGAFTATQGTPLDVVVEIPSPGVEASANATGPIFAGTVLTLTCTVALDGVLSGMFNDPSVTTVWTQDGQEVSTGSNITVSGATITVGTTYSSTLSFNTVHADDAGDYTCTATVSPSVPSGTVTNGVGSSDQVTVSVNVPEITVSLKPNTTRIPTGTPYNTFTVTCTATAPEGVVAGKTIEWKRRIGSSTTGLSEITDNGNTIQIMTIGLNQPVTISVLTVTDTTPGDYHYRCRVDISEIDINDVDGDVYPINVIGPVAPVKPTNLMGIFTSFDSATIQWTVPQIAFTPETYVVHYGMVGTNMGSLNLMSGDDFEAENITFTIQLNGLHPGTTYYYHVNATNSNASTLSDIELFKTHDQPPSAPPQDFIIKTVSGEPTMLHFSWDPPPENKQNGNITNYRLFCNPDRFGGVLKVFHQSSNIDVVLDGFRPATSYQCRVSAGTSAGYGPDDTLPIMTLENTPGSPPQNVRLLAKSPSSVLVTWVEPDVPNGVIILYTVYVNGSMDGTTEGTVTMYTITGLLPYQLVTVSVSAHTAVGEGPESNAISVRSKEAAPGKVSNLVAVGLDSTTLYVSWDKPVALNGILQNYTIFVNEMDSGENIAVKEVDVSTQNITIHQFGPGIPYNVSVAAVNSAGRGDLESVIAFTEEETPSAPESVKVMRLNETHMNVSWELLTAIQARGHVTNYTISYQPTGTVEQKTKVVPGDQSSVVIGGLDPYQAYSVQVWANTAAGGGNTSETLTTEAVLSQQESDSEDGAGSAAGGAVGAILTIVIVVACCIVAIVVVRWLRRHGKLQFSDRPRSKSTTVTKQQEMAPDISSEGGVELTAIGKEDSANVDNDDYFEDTSLMVGERTRPIPVSLFGAHVERMSQDRNKGLELEYRSLGKQPQSSYDVSEIPHNKVRNRFINIFPYDFSRMKLKEIEGVDGSDYINASFLDGYRKKRAYIGAQGPLPNSLTDFVRMIWEQRLPTVVMVTRCFESARKKCEQYWPENIDETLTPGLNLSVTLTSVLPYAEYEVRKFTVKDDSDPEEPPLQVTHFYYLGWPDHGVPTNAMSVINFIKQVRKVHPPSHNRPLLVHCSAGVGRTGTFIVIDSMLQRMKEEDSLNIFEFLRKLRSQRVLMVQTETQYVFIHDALNELITCGETEILAGNLRITTNQLNRHAEGKKISGFQNQYEILEQVSCKVKDGDYTEAMASYNFHKNRYTHKLACESARVVLRSTAAHGSDYINASFINGYRQCGAYIATQGPPKSTVNDFWRMMWEYQSKCIVQLCSLQEKGAEACYPYWPMVLGESVTFGKLTVTMQSESTNTDHVVRKLVVSEKKAMPVDDDSFTVTQFQYTEWAEEGEPQPTTSSLLELVKSVTKIQMGTRYKPITVICNDGMGRTGTFICIHAQLECLKTEGMVDIFQYIKSARINRAGMVQNLEQYILCHDAVSDYVDTFDTYANFKELV